jgi:hypothetical protein
MRAYITRPFGGDSFTVQVVLSTALAFRTTLAQTTVLMDMGCLLYIGRAKDKCGGTGYIKVCANDVNFTNTLDRYP